MSLRAAGLYQGRVERSNCWHPVQSPLPDSAVPRTSLSRCPPFVFERLACLLLFLKATAVGTSQFSGTAWVPTGDEELDP